MSDSVANTQLSTSVASASACTAHNRPVIVGIYGLPGSGKTFLLNQLKPNLGEAFAFYEGSEVIADIVPGGLEAFQKLEEQDKVNWRESAVDKIAKECRDSGKVGVVAAHFVRFDNVVSLDTKNSLC